MLRFVVYLYKEGLKVRTIKSYLAAIRHAQITLGLGNPHMEHMAQLKYIVHRVKKQMSGPSQPRLPITPNLLEQMRHEWFSV